MSNNKEGNYIFLKEKPDVPEVKTPTQIECKGYEYMEMAQMCRIAKQKKLGESRACNAFGGDNGDIDVLSVRMSRVAWVGKKLRKYVLVSAVIDYFKEMGVEW